jgi:tetratricopeptide (TPR) repeat protein
MSRRDWFSSGLDGESAKGHRRLCGICDTCARKILKADPQPLENTQQILWNYEVKLKKFSLPTYENHAASGSRHHAAGARRRSCPRIPRNGQILTSCLDFNAIAQEVPPAYIEPGIALRFYPGDEDTRLGWVHLTPGNYGLAERYYRRAVEATHQNDSAWIGLAASYDRLGRFDLADLAYRQAILLEGKKLCHPQQPGLFLPPKRRRS